MARHNKWNNVLKIYHLCYNILFTHHYYLVSSQVLDARDPMGTRSSHIESFMKKEKQHKHLIFVLNKCDLVPTWVTVRNCSFIIIAQKLMKGKCSHCLSPSHPSPSLSHLSLLLPLSLSPPTPILRATWCQDTNSSSKFLFKNVNLKCSRGE